MKRIEAAEKVVHVPPREMTSGVLQVRKVQQVQAALPAPSAPSEQSFLQRFPLMGTAALAVSVVLFIFNPARAQGEDLGTELPETKREGFTEYRQQAKEVASDLICFCPGCDERTVLSECNCSFAYRELDRVETLLSEGKTPEEVIALYVEEHGRFVLAVPPAEGFHLMAWGLPFVGMLLGALILWRVLRRITTPRKEGAAPAAVETSSTSPELLKRAQEELEKYDF